MYLFCFLHSFFIPRSTSRLQSQMWRVAFEAEQFSDFDSLLSLFSFEMHLYAHETQDQKVFQRIGEVLKKKRSESVHLFLHVNEKLITRSLQKAIFESLSNIATIRYNQWTLIHTTLTSWCNLKWFSFIQVKIWFNLTPIIHSTNIYFFFLFYIYSFFISLFFCRISPHQFKVAIETDLYVQGAIYEMKTGQRCVRNLLSVFSNNQRENFEEQCKFLLNLQEQGKNMDVLPVLQPVFYALPTTWVVQPSNPSMSLLFQTMEALNLKKPAELDNVTYTLSELKLFLQCMPYVTEMRWVKFTNFFENCSYKITGKSSKI